MASVSISGRGEGSNADRSTVAICTAQDRGSDSESGASPIPADDKPQERDAGNPVNAD